jgi:phospholipase D1/2
MRSGMLMLVATCGRCPLPLKMPGSRCGFLTVGSLFLTHELLGPDVCQGWLSPELYLRRPPAKNEQYRLDRMLKAAAERGVQVNVIVYKEVGMLFL